MPYLLCESNWECVSRIDSECNAQNTQLLSVEEGEKNSERETVLILSRVLVSSGSAVEAQIIPN